MADHISSSVSWRPRALLLRAKERASGLGMSVSQYVCKLVADDLEKNKPLEMGPSDYLKSTKISVGGVEPLFSVPPTYEELQKTGLIASKDKTHNFQYVNKKFLASLTTSKEISEVVQAAVENVLAQLAEQQQAEEDILLSDGIPEAVDVEMQTEKQAQQGLATPPTSKAASRSGKKSEQIAVGQKGKGSRPKSPKKAPK